MISLRALTAFSISISLAFAASGEWKPMRGANFTAAFPGDPIKLLDSRVSPSSGKLEFTTYRVMDQGRAIYMIQDTKVVQGFTPGAKDVDIEATIINGFVKSIGGEVVSVAKTSLQGRDALYALIKRGNEMGRAFSVNAGNHNYLVVVTASASEINSESSTKFLNSFKVTK